MTVVVSERMPQSCRLAAAVASLGGRLVVAGATTWSRALDRHPDLTIAVIWRDSADPETGLATAARRRGLRVCVAGPSFADPLIHFEEAEDREGWRLGDPGWQARLELPADPGILEPLRARVLAWLARDRGRTDRDSGLPTAWPQSALLLLVPVSTAALERLLRACRWTVVLPAEHAASLSADVRARVAVIERRHAVAALARVDGVVTDRAEEVVAAGLAGIKPIQVGRVWCGGLGFTHDVADPDSAIEALCAGRLVTTLTLDDFRRFEDFLVRAVACDLVGKDARGVQEIACRLVEPGHVPVCAGSLPAQTGRGHALALVAEILANPCPWLRDLVDCLGIGTGSALRPP